MNLQSQINERLSVIEMHRSKIISSTNSRDAWQADVNKLTCNFSLKNKQQNCLNDKAYKQSRVAFFQADIDGRVKAIASLEADVAELIKQREAESEAIKILASQGTTPGAVQSAASAQADAARLAAEAQAQSQIVSASTEAASAAAQKEKEAQTQQIVIVAVVVVVLLVVGLILKNRFSK